MPEGFWISYDWFDMPYMMSVLKLEMGMEVNIYVNAISDLFLYQ